MFHVTFFWRKNLVWTLVQILKYQIAVHRNTGEYLQPLVQLEPLPQKSMRTSGETSAKTASQLSLCKQRVIQIGTFWLEHSLICKVSVRENWPVTIWIYRSSKPFFPVRFRHLPIWLSGEIRNPCTHVQRWFLSIHPLATSLSRSVHQLASATSGRWRATAVESKGVDGN